MTYADCLILVRQAPIVDTARFSLESDCGLLHQEVDVCPAVQHVLPKYENAGPDQQTYYRWLLGEFQKGSAPDVQGNLSYPSSVS